MLYTFYIAGFLSLAILFSTYYFLGLKALITNTMMLGMYAFIVPCLFFTFGDWVEGKVVDNQINRLLDETVGDIEAFGVTLPSINVPIDDSEDEKVAKSNQKLIVLSFAFVITLAFLCFAITYILWRFMKNNFSYNHIFKENLIILGFIILVELLYFGVIVKNYRSLDSNALISKILNDLGAKFDP